MYIIDVFTNIAGPTSWKKPRTCLYISDSSKCSVYLYCYINWTEWFPTQFHNQKACLFFLTQEGYTRFAMFPSPSGCSHICIHCDFTTIEMPSVCFTFLCISVRFSPWYLCSLKCICYVSSGTLQEMETRTDLHVWRAAKFHRFHSVSGQEGAHGNNNGVNVQGNSRDAVRPIPSWRGQPEDRRYDNVTWKYIMYTLHKLLAYYRDV